MRLICGHCGHVNPSGVSFCEQCDEYLDWTAVEAPDAPAPAASTPLPPAQATPPGAPTQTVDPVSSTAVIAGATRSCPRCATANPLERRFCRRCGQWLVPAADVPAAPARPWRSWWQRLVGPLNRADRAAYRRSLSPATRAFRAALLVLLVVLLVVVASPFFGNPLGRVRDEVESRLGTGRLDHDALTVAPLPPAAGRNAALGLDALHDDVRDTAWAVEWSSQVVGQLDDQPSSCRPLSPPTPGAGFVVSFRRPVDVREIGIESGGIGETTAAPGKGRAWMPQVVDLRWTVPDGDGPPSSVCQRLHLQPTTQLQRFRVTAGAATRLELAVLSATKPGAPDGRAVLRIGELTFWER